MRVTLAEEQDRVLVWIVVALCVTVGLALAGALFGVLQ